MDSSSSSILSTIRPPRVPEPLRGRLRVEQVDALAKLGGVIACVGVLAAVGIVASFWENGSRPYLLSFLSLFIIVYALGFRRSIRWRNQPRPTELARYSYVVRCIHVGIIGLLWSSMPVVLLPVATASQRLLIVYVSSGLIASAVVIAPIALAAVLIAAPIIGGTFLALVAVSGNDGLLLGSLVIVYSSLILITMAHNYRSFVLRTVGNMQLQEQKEVIDLLLREFEQNSSDWLWQTDRLGRLHTTSRRMAEVARMPTDRLDGQVFLDWLAALLTPRERAAFARLRDKVERREPFSDIVLQVWVQGRASWWSFTGKPVFNALGVFDGCRGVARDVTASIEAQARVAYMANHDVLTDLPNRAVFHDAIRAAAADAAPGFALLWLDLDRFKAVNDALGHDVGDRLLVEVGNRLRACVGVDDTVARLGGDEFAILQAGADAAAAERLASRISAAVAEPFYLGDGVRTHIGVTIGMALAPRDGRTPDDLLKNADLALYRAKGSGRGGWRFYNAQMDTFAKERNKLQMALRGAVEREEFRLVFQPIVDQGRVVTFETLLRWDNPELGAVAPTTFIPVAEDTGMIIPIGEWVLHNACREAMRWPTPVQVAINLSPIQFRDAGLLDTVRAALSESGLPPERLELELTETIFLEASEATLATLHHLRALGISIALDDFGTGYSSLSYLCSFPFDKVKIDQSFVRNLAQDASCRAIVRAITGMAHSLGMTVVAEGVEHAGQVALLQAHGCSRMQGYLFSRPLPDTQVAGFLGEEVSATPLVQTSQTGVSPVSLRPAA